LSSDFTEPSRVQHRRPVYLQLKLLCGFYPRIAGFWRKYAALAAFFATAVNMATIAAKCIACTVITTSVFAVAAVTDAAAAGELNIAAFLAPF